MYLQKYITIQYFPMLHKCYNKIINRYKYLIKHNYYEFTKKTKEFRKFDCSDSKRVGHVARVVSRNGKCKISL